MRKTIILTLVIAFAFAISVNTCSAAVAGGVDGLVTDARDVAFTFVGDVLDNYTSLILWVVFLMFIIGTIVGLAWKLARGRTR